MLVSGCGLWGVVYDDISCAFQVCVLGECVGDGHVIAGGGCGDTVIAHHIRTKVRVWSHVIT